MNERLTDELHEENSSQDRKSRRLRQALVICILVLAVDILIIAWIVPWVDLNYSDAFGSAALQGSPGYVITFLTVFANFLILIGLLAYYHDQQSYPSDRWK